METGRKVSIRLLGGFEVRFADGSLAGPWERPSARRLLCLLLMRSGRRLGREEIADTLFRDLRPDRAANAVSKALSMLRHALDPVPLVRADRTTIWIESELVADVDLDRHEAALNEALDSAPGQERVERLTAALCDEGRLFDEELYSDWAEERRSELESLRDRARRLLASDVGGIEAWTAVWSRNPGDTEACLALVEAYLRSGQRDWASRTWQRTLRCLRDEIGVEPAPDLTARFASLMAAAPEVTVPAPAGSATSCVGRTALVDEILRATLDTGRTTGATLLTGPAGIGKTALLQVVADDAAARGWRVLRGAAAAGDRRAPFAALQTALRGVVPDDGLPTLRAALTRASRSGSATDASGSSDPTVGGELSVEVCTLLDDLAQSRPCLVVLDDIQWMDRSLQHLLLRLAATARQQWALLLAARVDESAPLDLELGSHVRRIAVPPLTDEAIGELLANNDVAPSERDGIVVRSAGNPLFAIELARAATGCLGRASGDREAGRGPRRELPLRIVELFGARLDACSALARTMMSVVALLGDEASIDLLLRVGRSEATTAAGLDVQSCLEELMDNGLVTEDGGSLTPTHPLLAEASLARLNSVRLAVLQVTIASALEAAGRFETAARHRLSAFEVSGLSELAAPAVLAGISAGRAARRRLADGAAIELLRAALAAFETIPVAAASELVPTVTMAWADLGDTLLDSGDVAGAEEAYHAGLALAVDDAGRVRMYSGLGGLAYRAGDLVTAIETYRLGLSTVSDGTGEQGARLESDLGWSLYRLGRPEEGLPMLERVAKYMADHGEPAEAAWAFDRLAVVLMDLGRSDESLAAFETTFEHARRAGDQRLLTMVHTHAGRALVDTGRVQQGLVELRAAEHLLKSGGDPYMVSVVHWSFAEGLDALGRYDEALARRDLERGILSEIGNDRNLAACEAHRALLLKRLGQTVASEEAAATARQIAAGCADSAISDQVEAVLAAIG